MTIGQKASVSIFTSLLVFSFFVLISQAGLFSQVEKRVYSQVKVREKEDYLSKISDQCESYIEKISDAICGKEYSYLKSRYIESYLKFEPSDMEVANRRKITENLFEQFPTLEGIRLIDDRQNICFSTFHDTDYTQNEKYLYERNYLQYRNYVEVATAERLLPFSNLKEDYAYNLDKKIILDSFRQQMLFIVRYQPASLARNVGAIKSGTFIFYFNINSIENLLLENHILNIGDKLLPVSENYSDEFSGFIVLNSLENQQDIKNSVINSWKSHDETERNDRFVLENLYEQNNGSFVVLLTVPSQEKIFRISGIYNSALFSFSKELAYLVYLCLFISLLLVIFLFFSFKADYSIVIKKRITRLQYEIISQYLENKTNVDWGIVAEQIETRKAILSEDIKKSFGKKGLRYSEQIDALLNKSWTEIISVMKSGAEKTDENVLMNEIKRMLEEILNSGNLHYKAANIGVQKVSVVNPVEPKIYDEEELKKYHLEDVDSVIPENVRFHTEDKSVENDSSVKIDPVIENSEENSNSYDEDELSEYLKYSSEENHNSDEIEELEEIEDLEEVTEEIPDTNLYSESVEELEELEDVEYLEDLEEVDELEEVEEIEELSEDESNQTVEELEEFIDDDIESAEELEEIEDAEEVDDVAELEEIDDGKGLHETAQVVDDMFEPTSKPEQHGRYRYSNDTYTSNDLDSFPTVDNVFAEELCLGKEYTQRKFDTNATINFVVKNPIFGSNSDSLFGSKSDISDSSDELDELEEIEELENIDELVDEQNKFDDTEKSDGMAENLSSESEEIEEMQELNNKNTFAMNNFAQKSNIISILSPANADAIVEKDGVFSISSDLIYTDIIQDENFKSLVDSVLK